MPATTLDYIDQVMEAGHPLEEELEHMMALAMQLMDKLMWIRSTITSIQSKKTKTAKPQSLWTACSPDSIWKKKITQRRRK
jgi:hypothetical protein